MKSQIASCGKPNSKFRPGSFATTFETSLIIGIQTADLLNELKPASLPLAHGFRVCNYTTKVLTKTHKALKSKKGFICIIGKVADSLLYFSLINWFMKPINSKEQSSMPNSTPLNLLFYVDSYSSNCKVVQLGFGSWKCRTWPNRRLVFLLFCQIRYSTARCLGGLLLL